MSGRARLGRGGVGGEGDQQVPDDRQARLEKTADGIENLQRNRARTEENRTDANRKVIELGDAITGLSETIRAEQAILLKLAEGQMELKPVLARLGEINAVDSIGQPEQFRSIEALIGRIAEELANGRVETVQEIRAEIRLLARTIAALAEETEA